MRRAGPARRAGRRVDRHLPVMRDRVTRAARPGPDRAGLGRRRRDAGHGRARRGAARRPARDALLVGLDRDPRALRLAGRRLAPFGDRLRPVHAVYDELPEVLRPAGPRPGAGRPVRPRASRRCSSTRPSAASPTGSTRRWTCGWTRRPGRPPPTSSTATRPTSSPASCATTARSGSPGGSPNAVVRERAASRSPRPPGWSSWSAAAIPAAPRGPGAPGQAHLPGAADRGQRRAGGLDGGAAGRGRRAGRRRPDRRAGLPLARGPDGQASCSPTGDRAARRRTCRSSCPGTRRTCGCSPAAPRSPDDGRDRRRNPRAASARLRAAERIRRGRAA